MTESQKIIKGLYTDWYPIIFILYTIFPGMLSPISTYFMCVTDMVMKNALDLYLCSRRILLGCFYMMDKTGKIRKIRKMLKCFPKARR